MSDLATAAAFLAIMAWIWFGAYKGTGWFLDRQDKVTKLEGKLKGTEIALASAQETRASMFRELDALYRELAQADDRASRLEFERDQALLELDRKDCCS